MAELNVSSDRQVGLPTTHPAFTLMLQSLMPHETSVCEWDVDSALYQVKQAVYATQPADT